MDPREEDPDKPSILVVDDHIEMAQMLAEGLGDHGFAAIAVGSGRMAIETLGLKHFDAIVADLRMADVDGLEVLAASKRVEPERPVIMMTAYSAVDTAVESIRQGAYHYLTKPFKTEELCLFLHRALDEQAVRREARALKTALRERHSLKQIIGESKPIRAMFDVIERVVDTAMPVLITGETGTGKGLVARALHNDSRRGSGPFITVNCSALPRALLERELFGHVEGAITGTTSERPGLFVEANGGTLFLDEIGELVLPLQAKLLQVLETGAARPVATKERYIDVRIVSATNRDLRKAVHAGTFREDLLHRLDVVTLEVPPLRHRRDDIFGLAHHFLMEAKARHPSSRIERFSSAAMDQLHEYRWPGNVRELRHAVERALVLTLGVEVELNDLPPSILARPEETGPQFQGEVRPIREVQRAYTTWALEKFEGNKGQTAERLGIDAKTLWRWLGEEPCEGV
jgi:DNA-binding NtrC family response regulator